MASLKPTINGNSSGTAAQDSVKTNDTSVATKRWPLAYSIHRSTGLPGFDDEVFETLAKLITYLGKAYVEGGSVPGSGTANDLVYDGQAFYVGADSTANNNGKWYIEWDAANSANAWILHKIAKVSDIIIPITPDNGGIVPSNRQQFEMLYSSVSSNTLIITRYYNIPGRATDPEMLNLYNGSFSDGTRWDSNGFYFINVSNLKPTNNITKIQIDMGGCQSLGSGGTEYMPDNATIILSLNDTTNTISDPIPFEIVLPSGLMGGSNNMGAVYVPDRFVNVENNRIYRIDFHNGLIDMHLIADINLAGNYLNMNRSGFAYDEPWIGGIEGGGTPITATSGSVSGSSSITPTSGSWPAWGKYIINNYGLVISKMSWIV